MSVVGIDFGLQHSVIAAAGRGGVDVILNGNSNRLNPTMVGFDQSRTMGEGAATSATSNYKNTVVNIKRLIGLAFDDPRAQAEMKRVYFSCVPVKRAMGGPDSIGVKVCLNGEDMVVTIEAIAGMMVKHLGMIAAEKAAASSTHIDAKDFKTVEQLFPQDWVVAIPSYFTDSQRRAFVVGCEMAGIKGVQRLMHEHTAVALSYGIFKDLNKEFKKDEPTNVMFIDFGASCYTVSIVAFETGKLLVKSTYFDETLGGRDFDYLIASWIANKFEEKHKGKLSGSPMENPKVALKLFAAAEKAKKTLSPQGVSEARINLECLMDDFDYSGTLTAEEYEVMCKPLLDRLIKPIELALAEAKLQPSTLSSVEIVGGSTRIGSVKRTISNFLGGMTLFTTMNADEAVARGAALQSAILSPRFKVLPYEILEAQPYPIKVSWDEETQGSSQQGVEIEGVADGAEMPANSVIMFDRGLSFPIVRRVTLRRSGEFQVNVSYDEKSAFYGQNAASSSEICTFKIKASEGAEKKVRVNVKEDIHGIIHLSSAQMVEEIDDEGVPDTEAKEGDDKKKKLKKTNLEFTTVRPLDWTKPEIEKAFEAEVSMANADRVVRETSDMRNELESYIYDMRDKISSDIHLGPYSTDAEKSSFSVTLEATENWLYEDGFDAVKSVYFDKLSALKKIGTPIERRSVEAASRPNAVSTLQRKVEMYKAWLNESQTDSKYSHITDDERQKCHSKCDEVSSWMYEMLDKQGSLSNSVDPAVTCAEISSKSQELTDVCSPIKNKPAPKPMKEEKPPEVEKKQEAKPSEGPQPMETEPAQENTPGDVSDHMQVD